jgi:hypothetical protein
MHSDDKGFTAKRGICAITTVCHDRNLLLYPANFHIIVVDRSDNYQRYLSA